MIFFLQLKCHADQLIHLAVILQKIFNQNVDMKKFDSLKFRQ